MFFFWVWHPVDSSIDAKTSEKYNVSISKAEVAIPGSGGIYIGLEEGKNERVGQSRMRTEGGERYCANRESPTSVMGEELHRELEEKLALFRARETFMFMVTACLCSFRS
jgi:hypothetical protein